MICLKNRTFAVSQTTWALKATRKKQLWFAWKIVLLQYRKQRQVPNHDGGHGCDLLEKSYFCSIANNIVTYLAKCITVVICLKNRTFAVSQTTDRIVFLRKTGCDLLEKSYFCSIANNSLSSWNNSQRGCDLLEKSYFCSIANNWMMGECWVNLVVICLKNRTFAVSQTTGLSQGFRHWRLWFAWKIVLLQYRKQLKHHIYLYYKQIQRFKK